MSFKNEIDQNLRIDKLGILNCEHIYGLSYVCFTLFMEIG